MANYTQTNIYRKQMQQLGLNVEQYAKLISIPYEVVKDVIYDKEGGYSMEIKKLLRNTMFNKHQEIEKDFENAKYKAMEIKCNEIDYIDWYNNVYNFDMLKSALKITSIIEFEKKYNILIDKEKASHWYYSILSSKKEYENHGIAKEKKLQFIKQLYDIIENKNVELYINKENDELKFKTNKSYDINYMEWFKKFDIKKWKKENQIDNYKLANDLHLSSCTISALVCKKQYTNKTLNRLYDYVMSFKNNDKQELQDIIVNDIKLDNTFDVKQLDNENIEALSLPNELAHDVIEKIESEPQFTTTPTQIVEPKIIVESSNNDILRKILISRLTDEEKELIKIFNGKLD